MSNDGGPSFPDPARGGIESVHNQRPTQEPKGISVRQWYKGQATPAVIVEALKTGNDGKYERLAEAIGRLADALIAEDAAFAQRQAQKSCVGCGGYLDSNGHCSACMAPMPDDNAAAPAANVQPGLHDRLLGLATNWREQSYFTNREFAVAISLAEELEALVAELPESPTPPATRIADHPALVRILKNADIYMNAAVNSKAESFAVEEMRLGFKQAGNLLDCLESLPPTSDAKIAAAAREYVAAARHGEAGVCSCPLCVALRQAEAKS
jgi:hypothetical protein